MGAMAARDLMGAGGNGMELGIEPGRAGRPTHQVGDQPETEQGDLVAQVMRGIGHGSVSGENDPNGRSTTLRPAARRVRAHCVLARRGGGHTATAAVGKTEWRR